MSPVINFQLFRERDIAENDGLNALRIYGIAYNSYVHLEVLNQIYSDLLAT